MSKSGKSWQQSLFGAHFDPSSLRTSLCNTLQSGRLKLFLQFLCLEFSLILIGIMLYRGLKLAVYHFLHFFSPVKKAQTAPLMTHFNPFSLRIWLLHRLDNWSAQLFLQLYSFDLRLIPIMNKFLSGLKIGIFTFLQQNFTISSAT